MTETKSPLHAALTEKLSAPTFLLTAVFWQNVLAGMVGTIALTILGALVAWFYELAIGNAATTVIRALLAIATAGTVVVAATAWVQLSKSKEKHKILIIVGTWIIVGVLAAVTYTAFAK